MIVSNNKNNTVITIYIIIITVRSLCSLKYFHPSPSWIAVDKPDLPTELIIITITWTHKQQRQQQQPQPQQQQIANKYWQIIKQKK